jgi:type VI secretion system secreted protein VgrG
MLRIVGRTTTIRKSDSLKTTNNCVVDAGDSITINGDSITINTGSASIRMKKDGTITITRKDIPVQGSGKINVKASSDVCDQGQ